MKKWHENLQDRLTAASNETISAPCGNGVVTKIMWSNPETRNPKVEHAFVEFLNCVDSPIALTPKAWAKFCKFIVIAHQSQSLGSRLSVCEFSDRLRIKGFKNPGFLAGFYGGGIQLLEVYDDMERKHA